MGVKTIEAEYTVHATQYWEVEHIEELARDDHGPLSIDTAEHFYIKWGLLHVQWEKDGKFEEYDRLPRTMVTAWTTSGRTPSASMARG